MLEKSPPAWYPPEVQESTDMFANTLEAVFGPNLEIEFFECDDGAQS
jgi:hypothetical protein